MAGRNPYLIARFWAKVDVGAWGPDQCWLWRGAASPKGYGRFFGAGGKLESPHVFAYKYFYGEPEERPGCHGTVIRHTCDNPRCCNPAHLIAGTQLANVQDMDRKGRRGIGISSGRFRPSKLTAEKVQDIRTRVAAGETPSGVAALYGVDPKTIREIRDGKIWKSA